ncbi:MAG: hypothetical protein GWO02_06065 [Gammaproteobacteria bacterium]|nr:hypothetical protein [Gammaproteobacteria bacterium]
MAAQYEPRVGDWYESTSGHSFEVVAYDEDKETVEVQYFDGTLEELDLEGWYELDIEPVEPPEDWSGSMDIDREDLADQELRGRPDWSLLDDLDR